MFARHHRLTTTLKRRSAAERQNAQGQDPIQLRRTNPEPTAEDSKFIDGHSDELQGFQKVAKPLKKARKGKEKLDDEALNKLEAEDVKRVKANWNAALDEYKVDLSKGKSKVSNLDALLTSIKPGEDRKMSEDRLVNEQKWASNYKSTAPRLHDKKGKYPNTYEVKTRGNPTGYTGDLGPEEDAQYENFFNVEQGRIHADYNMGTSDHVEGNNKLKNNNILWMQYRAAVQSATGQKELPGQQEALKRLQSVSQHTIINHHTNRTLYFTQNNGEPITTNRSHARGTDEFAAILQSPNGVATYWLLMEQADLLRKTVDQAHVRGASFFEMTLSDIDKK